MLETQARLNRVNTVNPYGSSTYSQDPGGTYTQTTEFSPELQQIFDAQRAQVMRGPAQFSYGQNPSIAAMSQRLFGGEGVPPGSGGGTLSYGGNNPMGTGDPIGSLSALRDAGTRLGPIPGGGVTAGMGAGGLISGGVVAGNPNAGAALDEMLGRDPRQPMSNNTMVGRVPMLPQGKPRSRTAPNAGGFFRGLMQ